MPETTEAVRVDLQSQGLTLALQHAPIYRKHVEVTIEEVPVGTEVKTVLADGHAETTLVADETRRFVVTNPGGERYLIEQEKRDSRYDHVTGNRWKARGRVRAFASPVEHDVVITAPWGEDQFGRPGVMFAATVEDEEGSIGDNRYLIGADEFWATYKAER